MAHVWLSGSLALDANHLGDIPFLDSPRAIHVTSDLGHMMDSTLQLAEGSLLNVTCTASGRPPPEFQWLWRNTTRISSGGNLIIDIVTEEHEGMYWCVAKNQYGESNASMVLLVSPRNTVACE